MIAIMLFTNQFNSRNEPDTPAVIWGNDYQGALQQAKEQNKPILLAFHASWCPPCQEMKKTTYHDSEVIAISESFIRVMIDIDSQQSLADQYNIQGIPTYVILAPDGTKIKTFTNYHSPTDFIAQLKTAV